MTELDSETQAWLHALKLNKKLSSVADFQNGYNFGVIFDKLQLTRGKKFKNSSDLGCIFQNYKNVRDLLLQNFNYDFPVNNIIYRTEDLLKVLRDQTSKYVQRKKIMTMKAATSTMSMPDKSLIQPQQQKQFKTRQQQINAGSLASFNQTAKLPRKIQDIERKLDKFRQQKTRHELIALEERKQQIQQYRRVVMNNRDQQLNKVRRVHDEGKEKEKKVYDVWYKTEQIKKQRIQTDKQFQSFQNEKRNKLLQSLRKQQIDIINDGLDMFQLNCMRQGIELEKDPDKPMKPDGEFNKVVVMERIKDNISKGEKDKKERIKRENQKRINAEEAKIQSEALWSELNKVDDYSKKFQAHFKLCESTYTVERRMEAEKQTRKQKYSKKQFVDLPAFEDQQTRLQQFRQRKIEYLFNDVKWMEQRWKKQYSIAEEVVEALLQAAIQGEQTYLKNEGFNYNEWKTLQNRFLNYQDGRKKKSKDTKLYADYSTFNSILNQYIYGEGSWRNFDNIQKKQNQSHNAQFTACMSVIISKAYPDKPLPQNNKVPLMMPLKAIFSGPRLVGKTSHSAKLAQKFGVIIINPKEILKQSIDLAKPPLQQDPKKAGKKDSKKVQELTPDKIALKQFGQKMLQKLNSVDEATNQNLLQVIRFKLTQNFKQKSQGQVIQQYLTAKQKQRLRHEQALKDFEQAQKKPKKESKKGAQPVVEEPPKPNQCFYSGGFVLDDFPVDDDSIRQLEKELNCFIAEDERINQDGIEAKRKISLLLPIQEPLKDTRLKIGTFDLFMSLSAKEEVLQKRKTGRKMDPQTKIIYHQTFNPIPDIKGFAEKLVQLPAVDDEAIHKSCLKYEESNDSVREFYSQFGIQSSNMNAFKQINEEEENTPQQTFQQITKCVQTMLEAKYAQFEIKAQKQKQIVKKQKNQQQHHQRIQQEGGQNEKQTNNQIKEQNKESKQKEQLYEQNIEQIIKRRFMMQDCKHILQKYTMVVKKYEESVKQCLFNLDEQRAKYMKELVVVQKKFTGLVNRPDDKAGKILNFQQNYNKLLSEQSNIVKDAQASKHLIQRLSQLYDSLWTAIGQKKNESVQQRTKFKQSDWLNTQCQRVVQTSKTLLQIQLNYLCETLFIILILSCKLQKKPFDYVTEYLSLGIAPQLEPIATIEKNQNDLVTNKRLDYYLNQTEKCIELLPHWIQQKHKKMKIERLPAVDKLITGFVASTIAKIKRALLNIKNKVSQRVLEQRSYYQSLLNKMDEWIIQGIKAENDFVYQIYKNIKKCIEQARRSSIKELHVKQITDLFYPIKQLTLNPIPLRVQTYHRKLPIYSLMIFLEQVKTITNGEGKINFQIFKKYMDKRKKSQLLHPSILKIDYDTVQQYLVKDNYLYLKELALAVILWDVNVFDDDQLAVFKTKLLKKQLSNQEKQFKIKSLKGSKPGHSDNDLGGQSQKQQGQENAQVKQSSIKKRISLISSFPVHIKLSLSELVLMEGAFDAEEEYIIKHLIFEVFRESGTDYVEAQSLLDTLSLFDQLQLLRYGDAVMMLNI